MPMSRKSFPPRNVPLTSVVWLLACYLPCFAWHWVFRSGLFFSPCTLSWWHHQFLWFQMSSIRWWFSTTCCSCTLNFSDVMNCIPNHSDGYLYLISDLLCPKLEYIISSPHPHCYYPFLCHSSTCHMDVIISYLEHRFHLCPPLPQAFMAEKVIFQNVNQVILFTCFFLQWLNKCQIHMR